MNAQTKRENARLLLLELANQYNQARRFYNATPNGAPATPGGHEALTGIQERAQKVLDGYDGERDDALHAALQVLGL